MQAAEDAVAGGEDAEEETAEAVEQVSDNLAEGHPIYLPLP